MERPKEFQCILALKNPFVPKKTLVSSAGAWAMVNGPPQLGARLGWRLGQAWNSKKMA